LASVDSKGRLQVMIMAMLRLRVRAGSHAEMRNWLVDTRPALPANVAQP